ncbi:MAG: outer membrane beta-barrel domain-containing protein, partial [Gammaproteobacteria bacterium]|nr:outer membrane beta-barrel domain-containing protein [Gammaproteobacteria bacterium]
FYVSEDFFLDASYGVSQLQDSAYRQLGLVIFPQEEEPLDFYQLALGYNLFPGEAFLGKNRAWNSAFYVLAGVGNVRFIEQDHFSYGLGFGYRVVPMERLNLRVDVRDQLFESDLLGVKSLTHNLEVSVGASFYF